jgi:hypothetical protein
MSIATFFRTCIPYAGRTKRQLLKNIATAKLLLIRVRSRSAAASSFTLIRYKQYNCASLVSRFLGHTKRRTTVGRTHLGEWSARRKDLYMTTYNTHNRQTPMSSVGFEPQNLSRLAAVDLRLRPRGQWDLQVCGFSWHNKWCALLC